MSTLALPLTSAVEAQPVNIPLSPDEVRRLLQPVADAAAACTATACTAVRRPDNDEHVPEDPLRSLGLMLRSVANAGRQKDRDHVYAWFTMHNGLQPTWGQVRMYLKSIISLQDDGTYDRSVSGLSTAFVDSILPLL